MRTPTLCDELPATAPAGPPQVSKAGQDAPVFPVVCNGHSSQEM